MSDKHAWLEKLKFGLKKFILRVGFQLPWRLPVGKPQFENYCAIVLWAYGFPDFPTYRNSIAQEILQLKGGEHWARPAYFAARIKATQAKHTAYAMIQEIQAEAKKEVEAAKAVTPAAE